MGYLAGFVGEGEIGYAGTNAMARAQLAAQILRERLAGTLFRVANRPRRQHFIARPRLRQQANALTKYACAWPPARRTPEEAAIVGDEVEALYTNGPAGGGGTRKYVTEQIGIVSTLLDRARVSTKVTEREWGAHAEVV